RRRPARAAWALSRISSGRPLAGSSTAIGVSPIAAVFATVFPAYAGLKPRMRRVTDRTRKAAVDDRPLRNSGPDGTGPHEPGRLERRPRERPTPTGRQPLQGKNRPGVKPSATQRTPRAVRFRYFFDPHPSIRTSDPAPERSRPRR